MTTPTPPRCDWSDLPRPMCACKNCEGTPWPGNIEAPAAAPKPRLVVVWNPRADKQPTPRDWHDGDKAPSSGTRCRWNRDAQMHLLPEHLPACVDRACNGCKPCTHDDNRNPVTHCRARTSCTEHLDHTHPRTCPRCIARVRNDLTHIERLTALMVDQAIVDGLQSNAAMIAGPTGDPAVIQARTVGLVRAAAGVDDPTAPVARALAAWSDDTRDEDHPLYVLRDWEQRVRDLYEHPVPRFTEKDVLDPRHVGTPQPATLSRSVSYLSWVLTDVAQVPLFADLATEVEKVKKFLENVLSASRVPERGAPCKECDEPAPRLERRRAHWCEKEDCTREHDTTGARDTWVCPRNRAHWWTEADYRKWSWERADETKGKMQA